MLPFADGARPRSPRRSRRATSAPGYRARTAQDGSSSCARSSVKRPRRHDRVDHREGAQVDVGERRGPRGRPKASANASSCSSVIVRPAAARWPPKRSRCSAQAARPPWRSKSGSSGPSPSIAPRFARRARRDGGTARRAARRRSRSRPRASLRSRGRSRGAARALGRPRVDGGDGFPEDALLHSPAAGGSAPRACSASRFAWRAVVGEQELEREVGPPSRPAALIRGASRNGDGGRVDRRGIDAGRLASVPEARAARPRERPEARRQASARFSSTSGTTSAIVASATRSRWRASAG